MSESKECHPNNNDILSNCLNIINAGATTKKNTHRPSSHGIARQKVDQLKDAISIPEVDSLDYFNELLEG